MANEFDKLLEEELNRRGLQYIPPENRSLAGAKTRAPGPTTLSNTPKMSEDEFLKAFTGGGGPNTVAMAAPQSKPTGPVMRTEGQMSLGENLEEIYKNYENPETGTQGLAGALEQAQAAKETRVARGEASPFPDVDLSRINEPVRTVTTNQPGVNPAGQEVLGTYTGSPGTPGTIDFYAGHTDETKRHEGFHPLQEPGSRESLFVDSQQPQLSDKEMDSMFSGREMSPRLAAVKRWYMQDQGMNEWYPGAGMEALDSFITAPVESVPEELRGYQQQMQYLSRDPELRQQFLEKLPEIDQHMQEIVQTNREPVDFYA